MPESKWKLCNGYRMRLETDSDAAYRNEALTGRLRIESTSEKPTLVLKAGVWLWTATLDGSGQNVHPHVDFVHKLRIPPYETQVVDFELYVPRDAMLGATFLSLSNGLNLAAPIGFTTVAVRVLPERRFVELAEELARVSGHIIARWTTVGSGDGVSAHLTPLPEARPLFDSLDLELYPDGTSVYGKLIVDPQERTLADVVKAATMSNTRRYRLRFPASELPFAGEEFERLLRPFMASERHLPIPATVEKRDELPIASQPPPPDPADLPVPTVHPPE